MEEAENLLLFLSFRLKVEPTLLSPERSWVVTGQTEGATMPLLLLHTNTHRALNRLMRALYSVGDGEAFDLTFLPFDNKVVGTFWPSINISVLGKDVSIGDACFEKFRKNTFN